MRSPFPKIPAKQSLSRCNSSNRTQPTFACSLPTRGTLALPTIPPNRCKPNQHTPAEPTHAGQTNTHQPAQPTQAGRTNSQLRPNRHTPTTRQSPQSTTGRTNAYALARPAFRKITRYPHRAVTPLGTSGRTADRRLACASYPSTAYANAESPGYQ